jgi:hypothetical protein
MADSKGLSRTRAPSSVSDDIEVMVVEFWLGGERRDLDLDL